MQRPQAHRPTRIDTRCRIIGAYNSQLRAEHPVQRCSRRCLTGTYDVQTVASCREPGDLHQHDPGGRLSRRGPARGDLCARTRRWTTPRVNWGVDPCGAAPDGTSSRTDQLSLQDPPAARLYDVGEFPQACSGRAQSGRPTSRAFADRKARVFGGRTESCGASGSAITSNPFSARRTRRRDDRAQPRTGTAKVYVGTQSNGQGHETVFAQLPVTTRPAYPARGDRDRAGRFSDLHRLTGGARAAHVRSRFRTTSR
jgi:hypothetical protein